MRWRRAAQVRDQSGSGTVLALSAMVVLLSASVVGALWAAVSLGHHRAVAAADLAALSAAQAIQAGDDSCGTAIKIAQAHLADMVSCEVDGETVEVVVAVRLHLGVVGTPQLLSTARAGPVVVP